MLPDAVSSVLRRKASDRKVLSISPDASVYEAIAMMAENSIGALLVVSNGVLVGILSERDYARKLVRSVITIQGETIQYLQQYINGQYQS